MSTAGEWQIDGTRVFHGTQRGHVGVIGMEDTTGKVLMQHAIVSADQQMIFDASTLRELAADCLAIADELDPVGARA
jgi:hypothetical protein